jgi:hypothetical protein
VKIPWRCRAGALACSFKEQPGAAVPHFFILGGETSVFNERLACASTDEHPVPQNITCMIATWYESIEEHIADWSLAQADKLLYKIEDIFEK